MRETAFGPDTRPEQARQVLHLSKQTRNAFPNLCKFYVNSEFFALPVFRILSGLQTQLWVQWATWLLVSHQQFEKTLHFNCSSLKSIMGAYVCLNESRGLISGCRGICLCFVRTRPPVNHK